jgi:sugar phosphate isomerase/epimerase
MTVLIDKPFKLGTTSYIFPDHLVPNVEKLGPFFDEIEILAFESLSPDVLPSQTAVKKLLDLSHQYDFTYNIHLPVDVSLATTSRKERQAASDTLFRVMDLFSPLCPTTHTLHLEMPRGKRDPKTLSNWQKKTRDGLEMLVANLTDPCTLTIETLDYPFFLVAQLVTRFNLNVCLDAGHCIKYGYNLLELYEQYRERIPIVHLHGVLFSADSRKDHTALDCLPENHLADILTLLNTFTGVVSLEVFHLENLNRSLACLSRYFNLIPDRVGETG